MVRHPREQRVGRSVVRSEREKGIWAIHVPFTLRTRGGGDGTDENDDGADDDGHNDGGDAIPKDCSSFPCNPLSYLHGGAPMTIPTNYREIPERSSWAIFLGVAVLSPCHQCTSVYVFCGSLWHFGPGWLELFFRSELVWQIGQAVLPRAQGHDDGEKENECGHVEFL